MGPALAQRPETSRGVEDVDVLRKLVHISKVIVRKQRSDRFENDEEDNVSKTLTNS